AQTNARLGRNLSSFVEWMDIDRAIDHFRTAQTALSGRDTASLGYTYVGLAGAALWGIRTAEGLEAAQRAMDLAEKIERQVLWANAAALAGWHTWATGRPSEGQELLERAYEVADSLDNGAAAFFAVWMRSGTSMMMGDPADSLVWLERELPQPRLAQAPNLRAQLLFGLAQAGHFVGRHDDRRRWLEELGDDEYILGRAVSARMRGDFDEARTLHEAGIADAKARGNMFFLGTHLMESSYDLLLQYDLERAIDALRQAAAVVDEHVPWRSYVDLSMATGLALLGRAAEARATLEQAHAIDTTEWRGRPAVKRSAEAVILAAEGRRDEGEELLDRSLEETRRLGAKWYTATSLLTWARAARSRERYDEYVELMREMGFGPRFVDMIAAEAARVTGS
ncbi:MAG: hypothetical protein ACREQY_18680, partial [Candidatus Binatia bacterium]